MHKLLGKVNSRSLRLTYLIDKFDKSFQSSRHLIVYCRSASSARSGIARPPPLDVIVADLSHSCRFPAGMTTQVQRLSLKARCGEAPARENRGICATRKAEKSSDTCSPIVLCGRT